MNKEIATKMSPEGLEIANTYLEQGTIPAVCAKLGVTENEVSEVLNKREIKQYIDTVFLDTGYRNRFKIPITFQPKNIIFRSLYQSFMNFFNIILY